MFIRFNCPTCQKRLKVSADKAGAKAACPGCGHRVVVPKPPDPTQSSVLPRANGQPSMPGTRRPPDGIPNPRDGSGLTVRTGRPDRTAEWYYALGREQHGPVAEGELRRLAAGGTLRPGDLVWSEGMSGWLPARTVEGLFPTPAEEARSTPRGLPAGADRGPFPAVVKRLFGPNRPGGSGRIANHVLTALGLHTPAGFADSPRAGGSVRPDTQGGPAARPTDWGVLRFLPGVRSCKHYPASPWACPTCRGVIVLPDGEGASVGVCQTCPRFFRVGAGPDPVIPFRCNNCEDFLYASPGVGSDLGTPVACPGCGHGKRLPTSARVERNKWLSLKQVFWPCYSICPNCLKMLWADEASTGLATCCPKCKAVLYVATLAEMERQRRVRQKIVRVTADIALCTLAVVASAASGGGGGPARPAGGSCVQPDADCPGGRVKSGNATRGPAAGSGPPPGPPPAVALAGAVVVGDEGGTFWFRKKCERCGHLDSGRTRTQKTGGVLGGSFPCVNCKLIQDYRIQTG